VKNTYILPTDKLSKLGRFIDTNNLFIRNSTDIPRGENVEIYITSDEEIKEDNWCINIGRLNETIIFPDKIIGKADYTAKVLKGSNWRKIILTTDLKLIADGVQAIDDEFIQWFVKNPRCEEVKLEKEHDDTVPYLKMRYIKPYRILSEYKKHSLSLPDEWAKIAYKIYKSISKSPSYKKSPIKLTKMEETLEQYIERLKDRRTEDDYPYTDEDFIDYMEHIEDSHKNNLSVYKCLEFMYFAERKSEQVKDITYWKNNAEEDLREAFGQGWMIRERFDDLSPDIIYPDGLDYEEKQDYAFNLWFKQFRKK
jgi:hypothetical protein